ncbi:MAG: MlaD family protein [Puniceicoccales bacterium]|jgi:hypothetical protein|nr:MlaD family protein [Puniceicoccales bacterium]
MSTRSRRKHRYDAAATQLGRRLVLAALVLCIGAVVWWREGAGMGPRERLVLYFESSVNGIGIGTPVKVHGVSVGWVDALDVRAPRDGTDGFHAAVWVALPSGKLVEKGLPAKIAKREVLAGEIMRGLRGRIALRSPITGEFYIELAYTPEVAPALVSAVEESLPEIPVTPLPLSKEKIDTYTDWLVAFSELDFPTLETEWNEVLDTFLRQTAPERVRTLNADTLTRLAQAETLLRDPQWLADCSDINAALLRFRATLADGSPAALLRLAADGTGLCASIRGPLERVNQRTAEVAALLDGGADLWREVRQRLQQVNALCEWLGEMKTTGKIKPLPDEVRGH